MKKKMMMSWYLRQQQYSEQHDNGLLILVQVWRLRGIKLFTKWVLAANEISLVFILEIQECCHIITKETPCTFGAPPI
jgi:hypothetical protein